jgi:hypothetical protein
MSTGRGGLISRGGPPATRGRDLSGKIVFSDDYRAKVEAARLAEAEAARVAAEQEAARVAAEAEAARVAAEAEAAAARLKAEAEAEAEAARVAAEAEAAEAARVVALRADVLAHMAKMEEINKKMGKVPPPPPPVVRAPNGYAISPRVANFPSGYDYYAQPPERPRIELSPEALAYQNSERKLAKQLESNARLNSQLDSLRRGMVGGRKKKSTRQKKQHRRRNRRRSTRKYRK